MSLTIARSDLGNPSTSGEYDFQGVSVRVDDAHLHSWEREPDLRFTTIRCTKAGQTRTMLTLGEAAIPTGEA